MQSESQSLRATPEPRRVYSTLLALVQSLASQDEASVIATAAELVNTGRVVLTGNFKNQRLEV